MFRPTLIVRFNYQSDDDSIRFVGRRFYKTRSRCEAAAKRQRALAVRRLSRSLGHRNFKITAGALRYG
jgi:hypothetical protein